MSSRDDISTDRKRDTMDNGRSQSRPPGRQLDQGTYQVTMRSKEEDTIVGMVFVEGTDDSFACTEHWILSDKYVSPRPGHSLVVEATEESYPSRTAFFDAMRTRAQSWADSTYIEAVCQPSKGVPE